MPSPAAPVLPGADFAWWEFDGHERATAVQVDRARTLVRTLLQPARDALGVPIHVTDWLRPRHRGGVHPDGAAVDLAAGRPPTQAETVRLYVWLGLHKRADLGELIYEQPKTGETGHVHLTLPGWGGHGEVLWEDPGGVLHPLDPMGLRSLLAPIDIPGIVATVPPTGGHAGRWWWWLAAGALAGLWLRRRSG